MLYQTTRDLVNIEKNIMILVTGATGHLGSSVVHHLHHLVQKNEFSVLARNPEKSQSLIDQGIEVRMGDFNDIETLIQAFKGVEKLLLISTMEMNRFEQHQNVIDAAKIAGVKHVVYTGLAIQDIERSGVKDLMISHFQTEAYLQKSGLDYTLVRNTMYADAIPVILGQSIFKDGILLPGGDGKVPYALREEMGEGLARLLVQEGHHNKIYHFTGSKAYSYQDIARELSELTQANMHYQNIEDDTFEKLLNDINMPEFLVYLTKGTLYDIKHHQYEIQSQDLETILGRKTKDLHGMLKVLYPI